VVQAGAQAAAPAMAAVSANKGDPRLDSVRQHMQRYRELASQGKWADAGKELDAIQNEIAH